MRHDRIARTMLLATIALATGGCVLAPEALDGPIAVNLHVIPSASAVEVDAPGWFADVSGVYLCHEAPPTLPDAGPARVGWTPGPACHDYGRHPSADGLAITLQLTELTTEEADRFAAATDWYLLLLDLDGERVTSAVRSRFARPDSFAVS